MSSLYEMELENIKECTSTGHLIYLQKGGVLGCPVNSNESVLTFLSKPKSKRIAHYLERGLSIREVSKQVNASPKIILKVKRNPPVKSAQNLSIKPSLTFTTTATGLLPLLNCLTQGSAESWCVSKVKTMPCW